MKKQWKQAERKVAAIFGTKRTPLSGINSGITASDSRHPVLFIETKYRKRHSMHTLYESVSNKAAIEKKIPIIALREANKKLTLVVLDVSDLLEVSRELKNDKK